MVDNKVVVHIFGEDYPLSGVADPAYATRVAEYVDSKMKEAARTGRIQARDKVAILAALSMASELLEKSQLSDSVKDKAESRLDRIIADLDKALAGDTAHP
ncbi:MAG: cell division protein ZapA [Candidatus Zixiibacteriota bacterium]